MCIMPHAFYVGDIASFKLCQIRRPAGSGVPFGSGLVEITLVRGCVTINMVSTIADLLH